MSGLESFGGVDESKEFGSGTPRLLLDVDDALLSLNSNCLIRRFSATICCQWDRGSTRYRAEFFVFTTTEFSNCELIRAVVESKSEVQILDMVPSSFRARLDMIFVAFH